MLGMRILLQISASPGLGVRPGPTKYSYLAMNWQDTNAVIRLIHGEFLWCGVPLSLAAGYCTKKEAKYDLDATFAYQYTQAQEQIALSKFQKDSKRSVITPKEPLPCGQGMTHRADKHFAKKVAGGPGLEWPALHTAVGSPEGYHSARGPLDFDNDTEEELQDGVQRGTYGQIRQLPTPALSGPAVLLFVANIAQRRIGTGREQEGD